MAWDYLPFLQRPVLRLDADNLLVLSPRAILSWFSTDGVYHRLLAAASASNGDAGVNAFTDDFGVLVEEYALWLTESAYNEAPIVHGDEECGGVKTPDVAVSLGEDLVLVEVVSSRLRRDSRLGSPEAVSKDLLRTAVKKARQLSARIDDLQSGRIHISGVDLAEVKRIWPVVVVYDPLPQEEPLWAFLEPEIAGCLRQAGVEPLAIFDLDEYETLMGLVGTGHPLTEMLAQRSEAGLGRSNLDAWLSSDPLAPARAANTALEGVYKAAAQDAAAVLELKPGS